MNIRRRLIILRRIVKDGLVNFIRHAWLSVAAIAVMTVALTIILSAIVLNVTARNAIKELSKSFKVTIYLKSDPNPATRQKLQDALQQAPGVASVEYVDKQEAQRRFVARQKDSSFVNEGLALVGADTLPESLEVSMTNLDLRNGVVDVTRQDEFKPIVDEVSVVTNDKATKTIDRASSVQKFIVRASIVSAAVFAGVSVLIIFNTIRMAIFTRGDEIRIMKLIGATPDYIRGPFIVEAALYGLIASVLANSAVFAAIGALGNKFAKVPEFSVTYNYFQTPGVIVLLIVGASLLGMFVGILSSILAMQKHLKLKSW